MTRLRIVTNRPGTPTARNTKPTRTIRAAITRWDMRSVAVGSAASARNSRPSGHSTQPDLPKSVICSLNQRYQCGRCMAARAIGASTRTIMSTMATTTIAPAIAVCCGDGGHRLPAMRCGRVTSATASRVLRQQRRSAARVRPSFSMPFAVVIQFDRNTVSRTRRPMLML